MFRHAVRFNPRSRRVPGPRSRAAPTGRRRPALGWIVLLLVGLAGCAERSLTWDQVEAMIARDFPDTPTLSIDALRTRLDDPAAGVRLIDVRQPAEYAVSHLPGAVHEQDVDRIARRAEANPDQTVVVYCSVGYRSAGAAAALHQRGHENVFNLRGSIFAWANRDLPVVGPHGPTRQVHPYDAHWGQLLDSRYHP